MSVYDDPEAYAKMVRMPLSLSRIWCASKLETEKEIENAKVCPKCGKATLTYEIGDWEACESDYVYCENGDVLEMDEDGEEYFNDCDYVTDPEKKHEPLRAWYDFDEFLAMSCWNDSPLDRFDNLIEWVRYMKQTVMKYNRAKSA